MRTARRPRGRAGAGESDCEGESAGESEGEGEGVGGVAGGVLSARVPPSRGAGSERTKGSCQAATATCAIDKIARTLSKLGKNHRLIFVFMQP